VVGTAAMLTLLIEAVALQTFDANELTLEFCTLHFLKSFQSTKKYF
jgi:hypothetical protein